MRRTRLVVTPLARRIALTHGMDLGGVVGTGPGGRVCAADVRALLLAPARPAPRPEIPIATATVELDGADARALLLAPARPAPRPEIPIATATVELDVSAALAAAAGASRPWQPVGLTAVVAAAAGALLPAFPELNAAWGDKVIVLRRRVHVAVSAGEGWALVRDAGDLTARGVARALAGAPARAGGGPQGREATFAVISLPEGASWLSAAPPLPGTAAALSLGAPARRAVALDGCVAVRPMATLTLSYDARVADHHRAAAFLRALCGHLGG